jgi:uncharacterized repeat protein (TIGR03803 family)
MNPAHVDNFADRCIAHTCALRLLALLAVLAFSTFNAGAQTFSVLHTFTGGGDGIEPSAGVTIDRGGNLYGTSNGGGGDGVAYKLTNRSGNWILNPLLHFDGLDGSFPDARPTIAADGTLYGTTMDGGSQSCEIVGCGVVYHLTPPVSICSSVNCPWSVSLPWMFTFSTGQGDTPNYGDLLFDLAGNIYGVTLNGTNSSGAVYKLTQSGGAWAYSPLHLFESGNDGIFPESGLIMDAVGNLYGTAYFGGSGGCSPHACGVVYEVSPSGSGWTEKVIYSFRNGTDGANPLAGLVLDAAGNLYGAATIGGANGGGTIFELSPSGSHWTFSTLYSFTASGSGPCDDASGPTGAMVMDSAGNLYGNTCTNGAYGFGAIFRLSPSNGGWSYLSLHDFTDGNDGAWPAGTVSLGRDGKLYGTAGGGGANQLGTVWEITP